MYLLNLSIVNRLYEFGTILRMKTYHLEVGENTGILKV